jgi:hypothetical protein
LEKLDRSSPQLFFFFCKLLFLSPSQSGLRFFSFKQMAPEPTRVSQSSRSRPVAVIPIVPAVPLPARAKSKQSAAAATRSLPGPETRQNGEVTQSNGSLLSSTLADGVAIQTSGDPESNVADAEVNKDVADPSGVTADNGLEEQAKGVP